MSRHAIATTTGGAGRIPGGAVRSLAYAEIIAIVALTVILLVLFARAVREPYNGHVATEPASPSEAGFAAREGGAQRAQRKASIGPRITRMSRMTEACVNVEPRMHADVRGYERGQGGQTT